ncbi:type IV pilin [Halobacteriales archaeon Cl-PHB]
MADGLDTRAVSESAGVAILVGLTVLVTASVGMAVVLDDDEGEGVDAEFRFQYQSEASILLVNHVGGDNISAGSLVVSGSPGNFTWAELGGMDESENVTRGDTIQLSGSGTWGDSISSTDTVRVFYAPDPKNRTELAAWNG